MRRLASLIVLLLAWTTNALAYDGPTPVTYDQTLNTIHVVFTTQGKVLQAGLTSFEMTAEVPIVADTIGQVVQLQIRRYWGASDALVSSCSYAPTIDDVGQTVTYSCSVFDIVPGISSGGTVGLYPKIVRNSGVPATVLEHNGFASRLNVPVVGDDAQEQNDSLGGSRDLGTVTSTQFTDLVWLDPDFFKFTAPVASGSAEIKIEFFESAADLDLYVYNSGGTLIGVSAASATSQERVNIVVTPGETYYVDVEAYDSAPAFYDLFVSTGPPDIITATAGPSGTPNPVASDGTVALSVTAVDSVGHPLTYYWSASCPALPTAGSFSDRTIPNPTWTAPSNMTGAPKNCLIKVEIADYAGVMIQPSFVQAVNEVPDVVTFTTAPTGAPNPAASAGMVALTAAATDSYGHAVSYAWTASCPGLPNNGTFSPSANVQAPTWAAPPNATGEPKTCTIQVVGSDGLGHSTPESFGQVVESIPHILSITSGPTGTPNPVASRGSVTLSASASDSIIGHVPAYAWSAVCGGGLTGGTFSDTNAQSPSWTAPENLTASVQTCDMTVIVTDGHGESTSATWPEQVSIEPHTLNITAAPSGTPDPVGSEGSVSLSVTALDSYHHPLAYSWSASCTGGLGAGSYSNAATQNPTWTAPLNLSGSQQTCALTVDVTDSGNGLSASDTWTQHVETVPDIVTLTAGPAGTPEPVASNQIVSLSVNGHDPYSHTLSYSWSQSCAGGLSHGVFSNVAAQNPTWTAPVNATGASQTCALTVTVDDGLGHTASGTWTAHVESVPDVVTITSATATPEPVDSAGAVSLSATATDSIIGHVGS
ncbi:MAG: pre-peptidase C-terminal domain-containing protein [Vicinamibacterales bacterium]